MCDYKQYSTLSKSRDIPDLIFVEKEKGQIRFSSSNKYMLKTSCLFSKKIIC